MNYTVKQLATRWCCSDQHVRNLIQAHKLKAFRIGTARGYRIRHDEVERWESLTLTEASASDDHQVIGPPISIC